MKTKLIIHREFKITFHFIMFFSLERILLALVSSFDIFDEKRGFLKCDKTIFKRITKFVDQMILGVSNVSNCVLIQP